MAFLRKTPKLLFVCLIIGLLEGYSSGKVYAQNNFWQDVSVQKSLQKSNTYTNYLKNYRVVKLETTGFKSFMKSVTPGQPFEANSSGSIMQLPTPDGAMQHFSIVEHSILSPELALVLPDVKTFAGTGIDDPSAYVRMDWTAQGFHAMVINSEGTIFIDPYPSENGSDLYAVFYKKDIQLSEALKKAFICEQHDESTESILKDGGKQNPIPSIPTPKSGAKSSGTSLRTYRLAVAATGEYTQFQGGTVTLAQSAIVTTVNRITTVYNHEVGISFTLVNNSSIVFTNATTDPFSNDTLSTLIDQSQQVINTNIGSANYDIGHTFGTGGGGLATLGVVCGANKARAATGLPSPSGETFAIDFVAHEIGHQFSATHTFNSVAGSCGGGNRTSTSAYEPGSGTTIMAYAGTCDTDNVQNNSNAYFHTKSLEQIINYSTTGQGNNCPTISNTGNHAPVVNAGPSGLNIPINTPFALTGSATDADGDQLSYCWEEYDLGPAGSPNSPTGNAPIFRSFSPSSSPTRVFPKLSNIINNTQTLGEILPAYGRSLTFRLTVRDNQMVNGIDNATTTLNVIGEAGPFVVTSPNTSLSWAAASTQTVVWDVAQTDKSPINCTMVNILLSIDGGQTYPFVLASQTPNDGRQRVVIPNQPTSKARIKVEAVGNVFFDISNADFTITAPATATFSLLVVDEKQTACVPSGLSVQIQTAAFSGFNSAISLSVNNLPTGAVASFSKNNFVPVNDTLTFSITNTNSITPGVYTLQIVAGGGGQNRSQSLQIEISSGVPVPSLSSPANGTIGLDLRPLLDWQNLSTPAKFEVQIAKDAAFNTVVETGNQLDSSQYQMTTILNQGATYFWRVKASNVCGEGQYSSVFSFQTINCQNEGGVSFMSKNVPLGIDSVGTPTINSILTIQENFRISDVNVINLNIKHTYIKDLTAKLISPSGTTVVLFQNICNNQDNIRINLDDQASKTSFPCPPIDSAFYRPQGTLSDFIGESTAGDWTLQIHDDTDMDGGSLLSWGLNLCVSGSLSSDTPPFVVFNSGLTTYPKTQGNAIDSSMLRAGDQEDQSPTLKYKIITKPTQGVLKNNNVALDDNQTFTQDNLNKGLIKYVANVPLSNLEDQFVFVIVDSQEFQSLRDTFHIVLDIANPIEPNLPESSVGVHPNPSKDNFEIDLDFETQGNFIIRVYDLSGKLIKDLSFTKNSRQESLTLDLSGQASGVYFLELIGTQGFVRRRLMKID